MVEGPQDLEFSSWGFLEPSRFVNTKILFYNLFPRSIWSQRLWLLKLFQSLIPMDATMYMVIFRSVVFTCF